jgi:ATP-dependent Zn protease
MDNFRRSLLVIPNSHFVLFPGKTLLAKAVADHTSATFLRVVGSELIQKYLVMISVMNKVSEPW